jgi:hypothetical protein
MIYDKKETQNYIKLWIKEFREYRKRMNEKLLTGNNKVIKILLFLFFIFLQNINI